MAMDKDEANFITEATNDIIGFQAKMARKGLMIEFIALVFMSGLIALLSTTVALWVAVIGTGIVIVQGAIAWYALRNMRKAVQREIENPTPLDDLFKGFGL